VFVSVTKSFLKQKAPKIALAICGAFVCEFNAKGCEALGCLEINPKVVDLTHNASSSKLLDERTGEVKPCFLQQKGG
jgi:hypothetical protein